MTSQEDVVPAVLANTSLCAEPSKMMAAAASVAAAASPVGERSKVKVPEVNCPDGDTVTVGGGHTGVKTCLGGRGQSPRGREVT